MRVCAAGRRTNTRAAPTCWQGIPGWTERLRQLQAGFTGAFARASPDFQTALGYAVDPPGQANMSICSNAVAQRFDCLAVTLEM